MNENFSFFEWKQDQGKIIRGSLHVINDGKNSPWFVICHGMTGQRMGPGYLFVKLSRYLSAHGFSSNRFDFCGSGESDGFFQEMSIFSMQTDLITIVKNIREMYNPKSLIVCGHSFGGLIASLTAKQIQPDGLVLISPVGDPLRLIQKRDDLNQATLNKNGYIENGPHEMNPEALKAFRTCDPVNSLAQSFKGKLLVTQGDSDSSISVEESRIYSDVAQKAGIENEFRILKGSDHNYSRVSDVNMLCQIITSWAKERFQ
jgi:uncharacterized protein